MPIPEGLRGATIGILLPCVSALWGCDPDRPIETAPKQVVIGRLNSNSAGTDFLVKAYGIATIEIRQDGQPKQYTAGATIFHRYPRRLYMKMAHTLDDRRRIEVGSNDVEFWLWDQTEPGRYRYYWGRHENMKSVESEDLPIRPDHLVDLTGLFQVPMLTHSPKDPVFRAEPEFYELLYFEETVEGEWYLHKAVRIDRRNPPFPNQILMYDPGGYPIMKAELKDYRPMTEVDRRIQVPHEIRAEWLKASTRLVLDLDEVHRFDPELAERAEERLIRETPLQRGEDVGATERVDLPHSSSLDDFPEEEPEAQSANGQIRPAEEP